MPRFKTSDGVGLYYDDTGSGTPLLCLAGLTRNTRDFDYVFPHLSAFRVIRMDYRGRGQSDWTDPQSYTIPREGDDALELLDHLGIRQAAILGTSRGGLIAMALAAAAKDRLLGVCLNDIGPVIAESGLDKIKAYVGKDPKYPTLEALAEAMPGLYPEFRGVPASRWMEETERHFVQGPEGVKINYDPRLREAVLETGGVPAPDLWPYFEALEGLPVALIRGASSDLLSSATADEMERRLPHMLRADIPGRGHVPYLDEPESLALIEAWGARI